MMQDDDGRLVEAIKKAMQELLDDSEVSAAVFARSALASIEREGWKVVEVKREYPTSEEVIAYIKAHPEEVGANLRKNNALYRHLSAAPKQG